MRNRLIGSVGFVAVVVAVLFGSGTSAFAQEKGKVGLTMGYPAAVGVIFHVTDKLAIRPELSFATSSTEIDGPIIAGSSDSFAIGTGVSALFYLRRWDDVHFYVSPRWTYTHSSSSTSTISDIPIDIEDESTINGWSLAGSIGAQYGLGKRFGVFGEVGISYQRSRMTLDSVTGTESTGSGIGIRSGVGVILYF